MEGSGGLLVVEPKDGESRTCESDGMEFEATRFSPRETYSWAYRLLHMIFYLNEVYARTPDTLTVHSATHSQLC